MEDDRIDVGNLPLSKGYCSSNSSCKICTAICSSGMEKNRFACKYMKILDIRERKKEQTKQPAGDWYHHNSPPKVRFISIYHPYWKVMQDALAKHWDILVMDPSDVPSNVKELTGSLRTQSLFREFFWIKGSEVGFATRGKCLACAI